MLAGEGVTRAKAVASVLFRSDVRSIRSAEVVDLVPSDPEHFKRVRWADVKGVTMSKLAVTLGLAKSRSMSLVPIPSSHVPSGPLPPLSNPYSATRSNRRGMRQRLTSRLRRGK